MCSARRRRSRAESSSFAERASFTAWPPIEPLRHRLELSQKLHGLGNEAFAGALLDEAVEAGPRLVAAEVVASGGRGVADIVVRHSGNVRVPERRAPLDLDPESREELAGDADPDHVADPESLQ